MQGLSRIAYTDLFWETLGDIRGTPYFRQACDSIRACALNKMANRNFSSATDEPFSAQKELKGIWHARIVSSPLRLLFYTIEGDTLRMGCVGTHDDYGWKGKNSGAAQRLVDRISNSMRKGHVPFSDWDPPRWSDPSQLLHHHDLPLLGRKALLKLNDQLRDEYETFSLYERRHGKAALANDDLAYEWITKIEQARERLGEIITSRPYLERDFKNATPVHFAMIEPPAKNATGYGAFR
jgi:hypothetical protein